MRQAVKHHKGAALSHFQSTKRAVHLHEERNTHKKMERMSHHSLSGIISKWQKRKQLHKTRLETYIAVVITTVPVACKFEQCSGLDLRNQSLLSPPKRKQQTVQWPQKLQQSSRGAFAPRHRCHVRCVSKSHFLVHRLLENGSRKTVR